MTTQISLKHDLVGHKGPIYAACKGAIDSTLFSISSDKIISCWDYEKGENLPLNIKIDHAGYALCGEGNRIWYGSLQGNIHVIDLEKKSEIKNFAFHKFPIYQLLAIPEFGLLCSADAKGNIGIWDTVNLKNLALIPITTDKIRSLAFDKKNSSLVIGLYSGKVEGLNLKTLNKQSFEISNPEDASIFSSIYLEKKQTWLFGLKNGHLASMGDESRKSLHLPIHNFGIYGLCSLLEEQLLISVSRDKSIKSWDLKDLSPVQKITVKESGHSRSVNGLLKLSERTFATFGDDGLIKVWEV